MWFIDTLLRTNKNKLKCPPDCLCRKRLKDVESTYKRIKDQRLEIKSMETNGIKK